MKAVVAVNLVLTFLLSASLNQLLGIINTQQLVVMIPLFDVHLPGNAG